MYKKGSEKISITKKDVIWSYIAQAFNLGANILILPLVLRILPSNILGIWYVFLTIGSFVCLLDFGFQPTFTRNVAFLFSGATSLLKEGIDNSQPILDKPNYALLKELISTMRKFYAYTTACMIFILLSFGTWYVWKLSINLESSKTIILAWVIYIISQSFGFFYNYFTSLLLGRGFIKENNILIIITKSVYMLLAIVGLLLGYGIIAVAIATLGSVLASRVMAIKFFYKGNLKAYLDLEDHNKENSKSLFNILSYNASKVGLANLAIFFTTKGNLFFVSYFLPLSVVGKYGLTLQFVTLITTLSSLFFQAHVPLISKYRVENNKKEIQKIFGEGIMIMIMGYILLSCFVLFFGDFILQLLGSKTHLLSTLPLLLLLFIYFLDTNHNLSLVLLVTKNRIPYLKAALISGLSIGILSPIFMGVFNWGVYGAILATGMIQVLYHNWKWPLEASKDLDRNYFSMIIEGFSLLKQKVIG